MTPLLFFTAFVFTLTALRAENRSNQKIKLVRLVAMTVLAAMLICTMYTVGWTSGITRRVNAHNSTSITEFPNDLPAWCLFHPKKTWTDRKYLIDVQYNWVYISLALFILIYSYLTRAILLFCDMGEGLRFVLNCFGLPRLLNFLHHMGIPRLQPIESRLGRMDCPSIQYRLLRAIYTTWLVCMRVYSSTIWGV
jgi:hypothetical protein